MVSYQLYEINHRAQTEPELFLLESDALFRRKIEEVAMRILDHQNHSPIVLLSGPSGSGKTTIALKLEEALRRFGAGTHAVSMDQYFRTVDPRTAPRTPTGEIDYESPECVDWELLNQHFTMLEAGEEIRIPKFEFSRNMRNDAAGKRLKLHPNEIVIFEGIHALRDTLSERHPGAMKLYVSARSDILDGDQVCFKGTWMRLVRRAVRNYQFRGSDVEFTLKHWANVRRGEKRYISPFKYKADILLDSSLPYEVLVMKHFALPIFEAVPEENPRREELLGLIHAFDEFTPIDPALVPKDSLLREFIGGGQYRY